MAQINSGLHKLLDIPALYNFIQRALGKNRALRRFTNLYVKPKTDSKILDVGCGTSDILSFLPSTVLYSGYDLSLKYINAARARFGDRGIWHCAPVSDICVSQSETFDIVIASGLLHHLDDLEAKQLIAVAYSLLKRGGRFLCLENVYTDDQSKISRFLINIDRGRNVRRQRGYVELFEPRFESISTSVHHDFLYVPYTHLVIVATKDA